MRNRPHGVLDPAKPNTHRPRQDRGPRRTDRFRAPRFRDQRAAIRRRTADWLAELDDHHATS